MLITRFFSSASSVRRAFVDHSQAPSRITEPSPLNLGHFSEDIISLCIGTFTVTDEDRDSSTPSYIYLYFWCLVVLSFLTITLLGFPFLTHYFYFHLYCFIFWATQPSLLSFGYSLEDVISVHCLHWYFHSDYQDRDRSTTSTSSVQ